MSCARNIPPYSTLSTTDPSSDGIILNEAPTQSAWQIMRKLRRTFRLLKKKKFKLGNACNWAMPATLSKQQQRGVGLHNLMTMPATPSKQQQRGVGPHNLMTMPTIPSKQQQRGVGPHNLMTTRATPSKQHQQCVEVPAFSKCRPFRSADLSKCR